VAKSSVGGVFTGLVLGRHVPKHGEMWYCRYVIRFPDRPALSQSLYLLSYPAHSYSEKVVKGQTKKE